VGTACAHSFRAAKIQTVAGAVILITYFAVEWISAM
jgi:hypothetical protein